jgi:prevent-host-death family protein
VATFSDHPKREHASVDADGLPLAHEDDRRSHEREGRATHAIGVRGLKNRASEVIDRVTRGERFLVTRRAEFVAVILSVDESLEYVLAHAEHFVAARHRARREHGFGE